MLTAQNRVAPRRAAEQGRAAQPAAVRRMVAMTIHREAGQTLSLITAGATKTARAAAFLFIRPATRAAFPRRNLSYISTAAAGRFSAAQPLALARAASFVFSPFPARD